MSSDTSSTGTAGPDPAILVGAAFVGGLIVAQILKRIVP